MEFNEQQIYERMKALTEKLGFKLIDGSVIKAEILGYFAGLELVKKNFDNTAKEIALNTAASLGLRRYSELIGDNAQGTVFSKKERIAERFSHVFASYTGGDFAKALTAVSADITYLASDFDMCINFKGTAAASTLKRIGKAIKDYVPPYVCVTFSGSGCDFDYWDSAAVMWGDIDGLGCPFSALDTMPKPALN